MRPSPPPSWSMPRAMPSYRVTKNSRFIFRSFLGWSTPIAARKCRARTPSRPLHSLRPPRRKTANRAMLPPVPGRIGWLHFERTASPPPTPTAFRPPIMAAVTSRDLLHVPDYARRFRQTLFAPRPRHPDLPPRLGQAASWHRRDRSHAGDERPTGLPCVGGLHW